MFAGLVAFWLLSILVNVPCVRAIPILHLEKFQLLLSVGLLTTRTAAFVVADNVGYGAIEATTLFVAAGVGANVLITWKVLRAARNHDAI